RAMDEWSEARFRMPLGLMPIIWYDLVEFGLLHREAKLLLTGSPPLDDPRLKAAHDRALAALSDGGAAPHLERGRDLAGRGDWAGAAAEFAEALDRSDNVMDADTSINRACSEAAR